MGREGRPSRISSSSTTEETAAPGSSRGAGLEPWQVSFENNFWPCHLFQDVPHFCDFLSPPPLNTGPSMLVHKNKEMILFSYLNETLLIEEQCLKPQTKHFI